MGQDNFPLAALFSLIAPQAAPRTSRRSHTQGMGQPIFRQYVDENGNNHVTWLSLNLNGQDEEKSDPGSFPDFPALLDSADSSGQPNNALLLAQTLFNGSDSEDMKAFLFGMLMANQLVEHLRGGSSGAPTPPPAEKPASQGNDQQREIQDLRKEVRKLRELIQRLRKNPPSGESSPTPAPEGDNTTSPTTPPVTPAPVESPTGATGPCSNDKETQVREKVAQLKSVLETGDPAKLKTFFDNLPENIKADVLKAFAQANHTEDEDPSDYLAVLNRHIADMLRRTNSDPELLHDILLNHAYKGLGATAPNGDPVDMQQLYLAGLLAHPGADLSAGAVTAIQNYMKALDANPTLKAQINQQIQAVTGKTLDEMVACRIREWTQKQAETLKNLLNGNEPAAARKAQIQALFDKLSPELKDAVIEAFGEANRAADGSEDDLSNRTIFWNRLEEAFGEDAAFDLWLNHIVPGLKTKGIPGVPDGIDYQVHEIQDHLFNPDHMPTDGQLAALKKLADKLTPAQLDTLKRLTGRSDLTIAKLKQIIEAHEKAQAKAQQVQAALNDPEKLQQALAGMTPEEREAMLKAFAATYRKPGEEGLNAPAILKKRLTEALESVGKKDDAEDVFLNIVAPRIANNPQNYQIRLIADMLKAQGGNPPSLTAAQKKALKNFLNNLGATTLAQVQNPTGRVQEFSQAYDRYLAENNLSTTWSPIHNAANLGLFEAPKRPQPGPLQSPTEVKTETETETPTPEPLQPPTEVKTETKTETPTPTPLQPPAEVKTEPQAPVVQTRQNVSFPEFIRFLKQQLETTDTQNTTEAWLGYIKNAIRAWNEANKTPRLEVSDNTIKNFIKELRVVNYSLDRWLEFNQ